ncbi:MAG: acyl carrier protein [Calditrichaeota bacterium]|nr:MAG: acyl carrier protein [Calditrichota bacterium]
MAKDLPSIKAEVKAYLLKEFLPGENPEALQDSTPLITGGILDSISTVKLVSFLEEQFGVEFQAHEMNADYLDSIDRIAECVHAKLTGEG